MKPYFKRPKAKSQNCPELGIFGRSAIFLAGRPNIWPEMFFWWPVDGRWLPLPVSERPTTLFGSDLWFGTFIVQDSTRKGISDAQSASVSTSDRVFCVWHSNLCKVYPFGILFISYKVRKLPHMGHVATLCRERALILRHFCHVVAHTSFIVMHMHNHAFKITKFVYLPGLARP